MWLWPLAILASSTQPVEGGGTAAGPRGVASKALWGSIRFAGCLLQQLGREASVGCGCRADSPFRCTSVEVVVAIGTQKNSGGSQCVGGPPPAVGIGWGLSKGHWVGEKKRDTNESS